MIQPILVMIAGVYLVLVSFLMSTKNLRSTFIFKLMPFLLGASCILIGLSMLKVLSFNL